MAEQYVPPTPVPTDVTQDDRLWALLAWIFTPIVPIIIMLMEDKKNRPFIRAHYMQALVWGILVYIVAFVTSFIIIGACVGLAGFILNIYWGIQAYNGKYVTIPVVTDFVKRQGWA